MGKGGHLRSSVRWIWSRECAGPAKMTLISWGPAIPVLPNTSQLGETEAMVWNTGLGVWLVLLQTQPGHFLAGRLWSSESASLSFIFLIYKSEIAILTSPVVKIFKFFQRGFCSWDSALLTHLDRRSLGRLSRASMNLPFVPTGSSYQVGTLEVLFKGEKKWTLEICPKYKELPRTGGDETGHSFHSLNKYTKHWLGAGH